MRVTSNFIILLFTVIITLSSCKGNSNSVELLNQAQDLIESDPNKALILLDSISDPQSLEKDNYMQYIVAYVGAKHESKADISREILIFEAQNYFNNGSNSSKSVLANYYAGWVYYINGNLPGALESFMHTVSGSEKSNNTLLLGKSLNNIGYIYYEQNLMDSAINNYQKALEYYDKIENVDNRKLRTLTYVGSAYEALNELDSAFFYFDKCLSLSDDTKNKAYQFYSLKNLGVVCYGQQKVDKAIEYFQSALDMNLGKESETRQIYLYLLKIYNKKQDPNLAKQYTDLVIKSLPEVTYNYTTKEMYAALADYYQQSGDYKKSLDYKNLEIATKEEIEKEADGAALLAADKNFHLSQKDKEVKQFRSHIYLFLMIGGIAFCIVLVFFLFVWRDNKKGKAEIRECAERYNEIKVLLFAMGEKYPKIEAEIKSILEDD